MLTYRFSGNREKKVVCVLCSMVVAELGTGEYSHHMQVRFMSLEGGEREDGHLG